MKKIEAKNYTKLDENYNEYTETEFFYDDYDGVSVCNFKNGDSIIMTAILCSHDINGTSHRLVLGDRKDVEAEYPELPKNDPYDGNVRIGSTFRIAKCSSKRVVIEELD